MANLMKMCPMPDYRISFSFTGRILGNDLHISDQTYKCIGSRYIIPRFPILGELSAVPSLLAAHRDVCGPGEFSVGKGYELFFLVCLYLEFFV
jgi:hypothetical protein